MSRTVAVDYRIHVREGYPVFLRKCGLRNSTTPVADHNFSNFGFGQFSERPAPPVGGTIRVDPLDRFRPFGPGRIESFDSHHFIADNFELLASNGVGTTAMLPDEADKSLKESKVASLFREESATRVQGGYEFSAFVQSEDVPHNNPIGGVFSVTPAYDHCADIASALSDGGECSPIIGAQPDRKATTDGSAAICIAVNHGSETPFAVNEAGKPGVEGQVVQFTHVHLCELSSQK